MQGDRYHNVIHEVGNDLEIDQEIEAIKLRPQDMNSRVHHAKISARSLSRDAKYSIHERDYSASSSKPQKIEHSNLQQTISKPTNTFTAFSIAMERALFKLEERDARFC